MVLNTPSRCILKLTSRIVKRATCPRNQKSFIIMSSLRKQGPSWVFLLSSRQSAATRDLLICNLTRSLACARDDIVCFFPRCHPEQHALHAKHAGEGSSQMPLCKSFHSGLKLATSAFFFSLRQLFNCFSLAIAACTSGVSS